MIHRVVSLLILLAVGVQTLPVRVCAVAQAIAGGSCHDRDLATNTAPADQKFDGHATGSGENHDSACPCEKPKGELDRGATHHLPIHLSQVEVRAFDLGSNLTPGPALPAAGQPPPDRVLAGVSLPLLN